MSDNPQSETKYDVFIDGLEILAMFAFAAVIVYLIVLFFMYLAKQISGFSSGRDKFTQINDANMRNVLMTGVPANVNWEKGLHP